MEIAMNPSNRIRLEEGQTRRRQLLSLFYKYINEDIIIVPESEYERLVQENKRLESQIKMLNEIRQAELDRRDIHRPV